MAEEDSLTGGDLITLHPCLSVVSPLDAGGDHHQCNFCVQLPTDDTSQRQITCRRSQTSVLRPKTAKRGTLGVKGLDVNSGGVHIERSVSGCPKRHLPNFSRGIEDNSPKNMSTFFPVRYRVAYRFISDLTHSELMQLDNINMSPYIYIHCIRFYVHAF
jgi:hypothetical protein